LRVAALYSVNEQRERESWRFLIVSPPEEESGEGQNDYDENH
jgi:hypothetical protein